jgi:hypothetical protein
MHVTKGFWSWAARRLGGAAILPVGRRFDARGSQLGLLQRWYAAQPIPRVVVAVLERDAPVQPGDLERALRALCARHSTALGVFEARTPTRLRLRPFTDADPLPWQVERGEVWALASELTHVPFATGAPSFRLAIDSHRRHVLLALDHAIADGISAALLASELAQRLAGAQLPPLAGNGALPLDARLDLRPGLGDIVRALRAGRGDFLAGPPGEASDGPRRTRVRALQVKRDDVQALLAAARAHGVGLQSALVAATSRAALEALGPGGAKLRISTPVSLREQCQPRPDGCGVFIGGIEDDLQIRQQEAPWELAQRYHGRLRRRRPRVHREVGTLALAGDLRALALAREGRPNGRTATLEVSNIGRVSDLPPGSAVWLTQGAHYHGPLMVLTAATSESDGGLRLCLSYPEPLLDPARVERFCQVLAQQLGALR